MPSDRGAGPMFRAVQAGAAYFSIVFSLGFALGSVRVLLVEPQLGIGAAALIELPLMLGASWLACGWLLRRYAVPADAVARLAMGALAFALLMLAELAVATLLFGRTPAAHLATYLDAIKQFGLAAQILFAALPLVRLYATPSESSA